MHLHMELPEGWMARQQGGCHGQQGRGFTSMGMAQLWALHLLVLVQQASLPDLTASTSEFYGPHRVSVRKIASSDFVSIHPEPGPSHLGCILAVGSDSELSL